MPSQSESFFQRTLDEKTKEARDAVQACLVSFLSHSSSGRQAAAQAAIDAVGRLVDMLHPQDRPAWLEPLHSALKIAHSHHAENIGILNIQRIANEYQGSLKQHTWQIAEVDSVTGFDFDAVYDKYKAENRIPQLFDEIISALNGIIASGAIDSVRVLQELRRVLATLQNARNGSYFATRNAWFFVATWFKNTSWELLGEIPVLGAAIRGLRKSLEDMNDGMQNLHEQMQSDLQSQLLHDFPRLEYDAPELPKLEHLSDTPAEEAT